MSEVTPAINCVECKGDCCSNIIIPINTDEVRQLEAAGTDLTPILLAPEPRFPITKIELEDKFSWADNIDVILYMAERATTKIGQLRLIEAAKAARNMLPEQGLYIMSGTCGNLTPDGQCADYDNRPYACRQFTMGGAACESVREKVGSSVPISLIHKPAL